MKKGSKSHPGLKLLEKLNSNSKKVGTMKGEAVQRLDTEFGYYTEAMKVTHPKNGWINKIRVTLDVPLKVIASKIEEPIKDKEHVIIGYNNKPMSSQGIIEFEKNEVEGTITINSLRKVAKALDMKLVYGFVPIDGPQYSKIESRANEKAEKFYKNPENKKEFENLSHVDKKHLLEIAIKNKKFEIIEKHLKTLWD